MKGLFITGTDTDIGKTVVSSLLGKAFSDRVPTTYFKPIQSGTLEGSDTETVKSLGGKKLKTLEPLYAFRAPISPNRAATLEKKSIDLASLAQARSDLEGEFAIVEGAGGCLVPINEKQTILDVMQTLTLPVVLVASTKLGTINHTLLSWKMMKMKGLDPVALVLVGPEDPGLKEVLREHIHCPTILDLPILQSLSSEALTEFLNSNNHWLSFCRKMLDEAPDSSTTLRKDQKYIWHPFTQHGTTPVPPQIVSGKGAYLKTAEGKTLFDGISSWWVNLHGHGHPEIAEGISRQAHQLEHVIFAGFTHEPAVTLVETLCEATSRRGCGFQRGFFSDNGSTAVEVALKMAFQFHRNQGQHGRTKYLSLKDSYHGDTLGAMSVGERGYFHEPFESLMFQVDSVNANDEEALENLFAKQGDQYAAFILEPMVQGAGGMKMYSAKYLDTVQRLCRKHGVLTIADEVFTGFYRTGKLFAFEHSQWKPDLLCLSKGITGGFLPLSLTLASEAMFDVFRGESLKQAFLHGHSYTANPVACQAALVSWDILHRSETQENIRSIAKMTTEALSEAQSLGVHNVRSLGTIGAFDMAADGGYFSGNFSGDFHQACKKEGVLLRALGSTVYTLPPYCSTALEVETLYAKIFKVLNSLRRKP